MVTIDELYEALAEEDKILASLDNALAKGGIDPPAKTMTVSAERVNCELLNKT